MTYRKIMLEADNTNSSRTAFLHMFRTALLIPSSFLLRKLLYILLSLFRLFLEIENLVIYNHNNNNNNNNNKILYLFTCWAQQQEVNYRISTEYKSKQYYNKRIKAHIMKTKQENKGKNDKTRLFELKYELLKVSTNLQIIIIIINTSSVPRISVYFFLPFAMHCFAHWFFPLRLAINFHSPLLLLDSLS
jgi:hypothetical protein